MTLGDAVNEGKADAPRGAVERSAREAQLASLLFEHAWVREQLAQSSRLKAEFLATMSHELRTPLSIIMGYIDLVACGEFGSVTSQQSEALRCAAKSAAHLLELVNSALNLSRLDKAPTPLDIAPVAVAALVTETAELAFDQQDTCGISLVLDVPATLGFIDTDATKLKVVLRNVIANALKFTLQGTVTVAARAYEGGIEVSVSDTGIGIAPEVTPIIFELFRQGDSAMSRRFGGVGLGLYLVRRMLDLLEGTISVQTEVGRGSTFTLWVPDRATVDDPRPFTARVGPRA